MSEGEAWSGNKGAKKTRFGVERKVSRTKACRAGRVAESDAWVEGWLPAWNRKGMVGVPGSVVPVSDGCRKTRLGVLGVKGGYQEAKSGMPEYLPEGIAGQRYIYIYILGPNTHTHTHTHTHICTLESA